MKTRRDRTQTKTLWLQVRIDPETKAALDAMATKRDWSMSMLVRHLVKEEARREFGS